MKAWGKLSGNQDDLAFASAMEEGFHSAGWAGALNKGIPARLAQRRAGYASSYEIATLYADLGEKDNAFQWLGIAYAEHDSSLFGLKTDFLLDPLRSDPRFDELMRKVGLPQ